MCALEEKQKERETCAEMNVLYLKRNIISLTDEIACNIRKNRHPFVSFTACSLVYFYFYFTLPFVAIVAE